MGEKILYVESSGVMVPRPEELSGLARCFGGENSIVDLTGPPGSGKTELAMMWLKAGSAHRMPAYLISWVEGAEGGQAGVFEVLSLGKGRKAKPPQRFDTAGVGELIKGLPANARVVVDMDEGAGEGAGRALAEAIGERISKGSGDQVLWVSPSKADFGGLGYVPEYRLERGLDAGQIYQWLGARFTRSTQPELSELAVQISGITGGYPEAVRIALDTIAKSSSGQRLVMDENTKVQIYQHIYEKFFKNRLFPGLVESEPVLTDRMAVMSGYLPFHLVGPGRDDFNAESDHRKLFTWMKQGGFIGYKAGLNGYVMARGLGELYQKCLAFIEGGEKRLVEAHLWARDRFIELFWTSNDSAHGWLEAVGHGLWLNDWLNYRGGLDENAALARLVQPINVKGELMRLFDSMERDNWPVESIEAILDRIITFLIDSDSLNWRDRNELRRDLMLQVVVSARSKGFGFSLNYPGKPEMVLDMGGIEDKEVMPELPGRKAEIEAVLAWLRRNLGRQALAVMRLEGPAGIGKTALLEALASGLKEKMAVVRLSLTPELVEALKARPHKVFWSLYQELGGSENDEWGREMKKLLDQLDNLRESAGANILKPWDNPTNGAGRMLGRLSEIFVSGVQAKMGTKDLLLLFDQMKLAGGDLSRWLEEWVLLPIGRGKFGYRTAAVIWSGSNCGDWHEPILRSPRADPGSIFLGEVDREAVERIVSERASEAGDWVYPLTGGIPKVAVAVADKLKELWDSGVRNQEFLRSAVLDVVGEQVEGWLREMLKDTKVLSYWDWRDIGLWLAATQAEASAATIRALVSWIDFATGAQKVYLGLRNAGLLTLVDGEVVAEPSWSRVAARWLREMKPEEYQAIHKKVCQYYKSLLNLPGDNWPRFMARVIRHGLAANEVGLEQLVAESLGEKTEADKLELMRRLADLAKQKVILEEDFLRFKQIIEE